MKVIITSVLVSAALICDAQEVERDVISSSGDSYSNSSGQVSYTIGEVVVETGSNGTNDLTQGFHQTKITVTSIDENVLDFDLNIFPNPTSENVTLKLKEIEGNLSYTVYSTEGKALINETISSTQSKVNLEKFAKGTYFIHLIKEGKPLKTYKIVKN